MKKYTVRVIRQVQETIDIEVEVVETGTSEEDLFGMMLKAEEIAREQSAEIDLSEWDIAVTDVWTAVREEAKGDGK